MQNKVNILNKKAKFQYEILDKYTAGIVLSGTEIKSIRSSKASIAESFCEFNERGELFVIKKLYDKRETIKDRDNKRNLDRIKKDFR